MAVGGSLISSISLICFLQYFFAEEQTAQLLAAALTDQQPAADPLQTLLATAARVRKKTSVFQVIANCVFKTFLVNII